MRLNYCPGTCVPPVGFHWRDLGLLGWKGHGIIPGIFLIEIQWNYPPWAWQVSTLITMLVHNSQGQCISFFLLMTTREEDFKRKNMKFSILFLNFISLIFPVPFFVGHLKAVFPSPPLTLDDRPLPRWILIFHSQNIILQNESSCWVKGQK